MIAADPTLGSRIHPELPYRAADVVWAARFEMARTIEDVLARRTRSLFLDAAAAGDAAPFVAELLARELRLGENWKNEQIMLFKALAKNYNNTSPLQK
jgi:glycerol-3-phosphate dehydrogenase